MSYILERVEYGRSTFRGGLKKFFHGVPSKESVADVNAAIMHGVIDDGHGYR